MSTHIGATSGEIAPVVLLPGDPRRAQWIAETFLEDATCYSEVRGMLGFTGTWQGNPISVQGSGMGQPSMAIYVNELFGEYGVESIIRVGSCGGLSPDVGLRDVIIASGACTESSMNRITFGGLDFAPVADFGLLRAAVDAAEASDEVTAHVGLIYSIDSFYSNRPEFPLLAEHGVLGIEMETSALYTLAARHGRKAVSICTVVDHVNSDEEATADERETTLSGMVDVALRAAVTAG